MKKMNFVFLILINFLAASSFHAEAAKGFLRRAATKATRRMPFGQALRNPMALASFSTDNNSATIQFTSDESGKIEFGPKENHQTFEADGYSFWEYKVDEDDIDRSLLIKALALDPFNKKSEPWELLTGAHPLLHKPKGKNAFFKRCAASREAIRLSPELNLRLNRYHVLRGPVEDELKRINNFYDSLRKDQSKNDCANKALSEIRLEVKQVQATGTVKAQMALIEELVFLFNEYEEGLLEVNLRPGAPERCKVKTFCSKQFKGKDLTGRLRLRKFNPAIKVTSENNNNIKAILHASDHETNASALLSQVKMVDKTNNNKFGALTIKPSVLAKYHGKRNAFGEPVEGHYKGLSKVQKEEAKLTVNHINAIRNLLREDGLSGSPSHLVSCLRTGGSLTIHDTETCNKVFPHVMKLLQKEARRNFSNH